MFDVEGNEFKLSPAQIAETCVKLGTITGFTTMVNVLVSAHCPALGVNVYVVVVVLLSVGLQLPVTPFKEFVGKAFNTAPAQIEATGEKLGTTNVLTSMVILAVVAHCPAVGVNVYKVVLELFKAGLQTPVIPFNDVVGKALSVAPIQIGGTCVNVGVTFEFTTIVNVAVFAHWPTVGVNV